MGNLFTTFTNCRLCINGQIIEGERLVVSQDTGEFLKSTGYIGGDIVDLDDAIIAPGFLDLYSCVPPPDVQLDQWLVHKSAQYIQQGVTGFWISTNNLLNNQPDELSKQLAGLSVSGPAQLGTHAVLSASQDVEKLISSNTLPSHLKLATLHTSQIEQISALTDRGIKVAMTSRSNSNGNTQSPTSSSSSTNTSYAQAESALYAGATAIAHPLDAPTAPLTATDPGPAGLLALHDRVAPYVLIPCDSQTMHAKAATLLFRATVAAKRGVLCSSSNGTTETTTTMGIGMDQCVRNMYYWANCDIAQAVQAVTENVAMLMGLRDRGRLVEGCRADFVVLDDGGNVRETWIAGHRVWPAVTEEGDDEHW